jgi:phosphatidylserine/phosphatidylglycerophosphate/cardiolipin synthase-like enzyme
MQAVSDAASGSNSFDCSRDATELAKLSARVVPRGDDNSAREQRQLLQSQQKWFPSMAGRPAYLGQVVTYLYGQCAFADFADALSTAFAPEHRIYILGWEGHADAQLKSGPHSTLRDHLVSTKAEVRAMLWKGPAGDPNSQDLVDLINGLPRGAAITDTKLPPLFVEPNKFQLAAHHQKMWAVLGAEGLIAFLGGMDLANNRVLAIPDAGLPWHDTQLRLTGPPALECRKVFQDRWLDHPATLALDQNKSIAGPGDYVSHVFPPVNATAADVVSVTLKDQRREQRLVRVARTIPNLRKSGGAADYKFAPQGDYSAWQMIENSINTAKRWIYVEDQYMVSRLARSALLKKMQQPGFEFLLVLMNPSPSVVLSETRFFCFEHNDFRQNLLKIDPKRSRWGMYSLIPAKDPARQSSSGSFVHSKTWIFDDEFAVVGSANCENRGYTFNTEIVAGVGEAFYNMFDANTFSRQLRIALWHKHLGIPHASLQDWRKAISFWRKPPAEAMIEEAANFVADPEYHKQFISELSPQDAQYVDAFWKLRDPDAR